MELVYWQLFGISIAGIHWITKDKQKRKQIEKMVQEMKKYNVTIETIKGFREIYMKNYSFDQQ